MQIAALAHDIDRAIQPRILQAKNESYDTYKQRHAKRSAELIAEMMTNNGYSENTVARVRYLVENHEVGGDEDATVLMDADSISYFDCNIEIYYKKRGIELTKDKIMFMYQRASQRTKEIINQLDIKDTELRDACLAVFRNI